MKKKTIGAIALAVLAALAIGGVAGAYLIDHFHLSEMPNRFIEQEADGARVRFMYFEPLHTLGPNEQRTIVIVFYDWKNNGPVTQVVYRTHDPSATDRLFYSDENIISALVDNHVVFTYDKKTRKVTKKEFGSVYTLIKPSSDWQRIIATSLGESGSEMNVLDGSGRVLMAQPDLGFDSDHALFFDQNQKIAIQTQGGGDVSSDLYTWDLTNNTLVKETDSSLLHALAQGGQLLTDDNGPFVRIYMPTGEERIPLSTYVFKEDALVSPRALTPPADLTGWKTFTSKAYGFSFQYPPGFAAEAYEGPSNFDKKSLTVDVGTKEYVRMIRLPSESEGLPLYLRLSATIPREDAPTSTGLMKPGTCDAGYRLKEKMLVSGVVVSKCEGLTLGSFPSVFIMFNKNEHDPMVYTFDSMSYDDANKATIDAIISTFKLL